MKLTRRYRFCASHRLHSPGLPDADNQRLYGKCNNPFGHGHDYAVEVTVRGDIDERTGRLVDLARLDELVRREVIEPFDHKNFNLDVPAFQAMVPTSENVAVEAGRRLRAAWPNTFGNAPALDKIRVHETPRNIFELSL